MIFGIFLQKAAVVALFYRDLLSVAEVHDVV